MIFELRHKKDKYRIVDVNLAICYVSEKTSKFKYAVTSGSNLEPL